MGEYRTRLYGMLDKWLVSSPLRSQWVNCGSTKVYMRKTEVLILRERSKAVITLANISVRPSKQGKGLASDVLRWMESARERGLLIDGIVPPRYLAVENVCTPRMHEILRKNGWEKYPEHGRDDSGVSCYLKILGG